MPPRFSIAHVLTSPHGEEFFSGFHARAQAKGSMICTGDGGENGVFVVMSGKLRVYLVGDEREFTLFYLEPGDIFCMHSGCLVEAVEKSDLRFTDIKTFGKKLETNPAIAFGLVAILGRAIMSCMRTIEELMFLDIKQRVAWFFVDRAVMDGRDTNSVVKLFIDLTVEEIANMIGSSRQATSTALNSLIKEGYISREGRTNYTILDMQRLKTAAATGRLSGG